MYKDLVVETENGLKCAFEGVLCEHCTGLCEPYCKALMNTVHSFEKQFKTQLQEVETNETNQ